MSNDGKSVGEKINKSCNISFGNGVVGGGRMGCYNERIGNIIELYISKKEQSAK
jgi:hypothetical protein